MTTDQNPDFGEVPSHDPRGDARYFKLNDLDGSHIQHLLAMVQGELEEIDLTDPDKPTATIAFPSQEKAASTEVEPVHETFSLSDSFWDRELEAARPKPDPEQVRRSIIDLFDAHEQTPETGVQKSNGQANGHGISPITTAVTTLPTPDRRSRWRRGLDKVINPLKRAVEVVRDLPRRLVVGVYSRLAARSYSEPAQVETGYHEPNEAEEATLDDSERTEERRKKRRLAYAIGAAAATGVVVGGAIIAYQKIKYGGTGDNGQLSQAALDQLSPKGNSSSTLPQVEVPIPTPKPPITLPEVPIVETIPDLPSVPVPDTPLPTEHLIRVPKGSHVWGEVTNLLQEQGKPADAQSVATIVNKLQAGTSVNLNEIPAGFEITVQL